MMPGFFDEGYNYTLIKRCEVPVVGSVTLEDGFSSIDPFYITNSGYPSLGSKLAGSIGRKGTIILPQDIRIKDGVFSE